MGAISYFDKLNGYIYGVYCVLNQSNSSTFSFYVYYEKYEHIDKYKHN